METSSSSMDMCPGTWQNLKHFDKDETKRITNNYSTCIGEGGFGKVYKGDLLDEYDQVAVKEYIRKDLREEFMEEVRIHSKMKHKNIVKLVGYCTSDSNLTLKLANECLRWDRNECLKMTEDNTAVVVWKFLYED